MTQQEFNNRFKFSVREDKIGGGSFGTVYKAYDNGLDREVAIKVSEVKLIGDKEFSLREEFNAIKNIPVHTNIANYEKVHRFEERSGIFDYAIMQLYPLGNLNQYLKAHELEFSKREQLVLDILSGISHLHKHKIVHRDLKPSNILLVDRRGKLIPKITDFGLSKQADLDGKSSRFTNSFAGGTLQYSSPEQLRGESLKLNTDLWSFGAIAYQILTGKQLFIADSSSTASAEWQNEITQKILHQDISDKLKTLPENWHRVLHSCLQREIGNRAKSTTELLHVHKGETIDFPLPINPGNSAPTEVKEPEQPEEPKKPSWFQELMQMLTLFVNKHQKEIKGVSMVLLLLLIGNWIMNKINPTDSLELVIFEQDNKYGYKKGDSIVIPAQFDMANNFIEDKALVEVSDSSYYINTKAEWVDSFKMNKKSVPETEIINESFDNSDWEAASDVNTISAYKSYLSEYPDGLHRKKANDKIIELEKLAKDEQDWKKAKQKNNIAGYDEYLSKNPQGIYSSTADERINKIKLAEKQKNNWRPKIKLMSSIEFETYWNNLSNSDRENLVNAAVFGSTIAARLLGRSHYYSNNCEDAFKWFKKAADKGDGFSQVALATQYELGSYDCPGGPKENIQQAIKYYKLAINQSFSHPDIPIGETMDDLATLYEDIGNESLAKYWYKKACENGYKLACNY